MLLPRATEQKFFGLRVAAETQGEIFLQNFMNGHADAVLVGAGFGLDRKSDGGFGDARRGMKSGGALVAESFAGGGFLELGDAADIAGVEFVNFAGGFSLGHLDVLKTLLRAAIKIGEGGIIFQDAGHYFEVGDAAGEGIGEGFKNKNGKRLGRGDLAFDDFAFVIRSFVAGGVAADGGRGKNRDHQIQDRVAADVVEGGTKHDREKALGDDRFAEPDDEIVYRQSALVEKFLHELVVAFGDEFHQRFMAELGFFGEGLRDFFNLGDAIAVGRVNQGLHGDQVHHAAKTLFPADGQLNGHDAASENLLNGIERALETGEIAIHPIQQKSARQIVFGGVVPNFFGDDLDAGGSVDQNQGGIGGDEGRLGFVDESGVAGSIEQIDFGFLRLGRSLPFGVGDSGIDGNFSSDFFFVPIGDRGTFGDFSQPRRHPSRKKQRRDQLGLTGVAVTDNADVANPVCSVGFHFFGPPEV